MQLKALELQGFKSFVDKTKIEFGQGITGIVGPNGSGKSNITDAIRWVMGEQSAKSLRGGNMQDVIFAGTQKRKPLGFAEVTLVIDNSDKKLPIEYDEVTITRRVFRSGESEYFINQSSVRLRDIHELFMDTGVGRDGYSIIGQGKIAEIVNAKSEDRRQMFEEASGITKFRYRKEEAERKLRHTEENILRVNDIVAELENQVEPLHIQSEKAKKYLNLREELKILDVNVSLENIAKYKKTLSEIGSVYADLEASALEVSKSIEAIEQETGAMFETISQNEQSARETREKQQEMTAVLAEYQSDIAILKNKIEHNQENRKRIEQEIQELAAKQAELDQSLESHKDGYTALKEKEAAHLQEISQLDQQLAELDAKTDSQSGIIEKINAELIEKLNSISAVRSKISNLAALHDSFQNRLQSIEKELAEKAESCTDIQKRTDSLETDCTKTRADITAMQSSLSEKQKRYEGLSNECRNLHTALLEGQNTYHAAVSRRKLLLDLEQSFDNYSKSVKGVMLAHKKGELKGVTIHGTVASLLQVDKKYAAAMDTALGGGAQNIVTETENDAKEAIAYLKRTKQGRATFLPVSAARGNRLDDTAFQKSPGYMGIAADLVSYNQRFKNIVTNLLARTAVVDTIDNAIALAKKSGYKFRIVTLEGELLSPGGSMTGGSRSHTGGIFSRANEITDLTGKIQKAEQEIQQLQQAYAEKSKQLSAIETEIQQDKTTIEEKNQQLIKLQADLQHAKLLLDAAQEAQSLLLTEQKQLTGQTVDMQQQMQEHEAEVTAMRQAVSDLEKRTELEKEGISGIVAKRNAVASEVLDMRMKLGSVQKDLEMHNERTGLVRARREELAENILQKQQNIQETAALNSNIQDDITFKQQQIQGVKEEIQAIAVLLERTDSDRKEAQERIQQKQAELKDYTEQQIALQQQQSKVEAKKAKAEVELENAINRLWEEYELTLTTAEQYRKDVGSITAAQRQINDLKSQIKALGNINIDAIEEYKAVKERYDFLTGQRDDLVSAQKNLQLVISDMMEIMKTQFAEKFQVINQNFGEVFVELFGGGKAQLKLTEPNDILSSGVDIDVQPPGKAIKSMLQLSGGEQAFVSIALLFAILKVRPAPFCILDEIEAALDDVNVNRFAEYVKKFTKYSQFIVVTHRRGTMEAANILYGVTMQERGVTKLLSMNIDEVVKEK